MGPSGVMFGGKEVGRGLGEGFLTVFFLIALAILWVAVLVPAMLRARASTPLSSTQRFRARMDLIAPPGPRAGRWIVVLNGAGNGKSSSILRAQRHARSVRRRRRFLVLLVLAAVGTLAAAFARRGGWWEVHAAVDAGLVLYVGILVAAKRRHTERRAKVRTLRRPGRGEEYTSVAVGGGR
jgi:hypothetical protein